MHPVSSIVKLKTLSAALISFTLLLTCSSKRVFDHGLFEIGMSQGIVDNNEINEASGLVGSVTNPGMLWTHNDSGDEARVFLIDDQARYKKTYYLKDITNRDWEDIAIGPGPQKDKTYLYVADVGDNLSIFKYKYIYRFPEPVLADGNINATDTIRNVDSIQFQLPDQSRDTEAIMADPVSGDIYIFSKREEKQVNMYLLPYPQPTNEIITAKFVRHIPYTQIVAADISSDGKEVLLKNYRNIYYWKKEGDESLSELLGRQPAILPYAEEPQGEAIAFDRKGKGYYTLSEAAIGKKTHLMFYKRKESE